MQQTWHSGFTNRIERLSRCIILLLHLRRTERPGLEIVEPFSETPAFVRRVWKLLQPDQQSEKQGNRKKDDEENASLAHATNMEALRV